MVAAATVSRAQVNSDVNAAFRAQPQNPTPAAAQPTATQKTVSQDIGTQPSLGTSIDTPRLTGVAPEVRVNTMVIEGQVNLLERRNSDQLAADILRGARVSLEQRGPNVESLVGDQRVRTSPAVTGKSIAQNSADTGRAAYEAVSNSPTPLNVSAAEKLALADLVRTEVQNRVTGISGSPQEQEVSSLRRMSEPNQQSGTSISGRPGLNTLQSNTQNSLASGVEKTAAQPEKQRNSDELRYVLEKLGMLKNPEAEAAQGEHNQVFVRQTELANSSAQKQLNDMMAQGRFGTDDGPSTQQRATTGASRAGLETTKSSLPEGFPASVASNSRLDTPRASLPKSNAPVDEQLENGLTGTREKNKKDRTAEEQELFARMNESRTKPAENSPFKLAERDVRATKVNLKSRPTGLAPEVSFASTTQEEESKAFSA